MPTPPLEPVRPAVIIRADGTTVARRDFPYRNLKEMQKVVGGHIEARAIHPSKVNRLTEGTSINFQGRVDLVVNEDGRSQKLPINTKVTRVYGDMIVGDVLLIQLHREGEEN